MSARKSAPGEIRRGRRQRGHSCWDHLVVAPLWVAFQANLGTLLRTCDAVGACIAVPNTSHYRAALKHGDTLGPRRRPCIHWVTVNKDRWIAQQRQAGWQIVVVELAEGAVALLRLEPAKQRTVVLLGHGAALDAEIKRQKPSRLQTELEFRRRAASAARPLFIGTPARHEHEEILRIWRAGDRVREERAGGPSDGAYGVIVGDLWWYWDPRYGASSNEENPKAASRTGIGREPAVMLNPIVMLSELRFAVAGRSEVAGRPTITAEATPRAFDQRVFRTRVGLSFELQELGRGAERYILEVDTQTGVLLEAVALFNGEPFHKVTILDVAFDHPIPDEHFRFQPPSSVRNPTIGGPACATVSVATRGPAAHSVHRSGPRSAPGRLARALHLLRAGRRPVGATRVRAIRLSGRARGRLALAMPGERTPLSRAGDQRQALGRGRPRRARGPGHQRCVAAGTEGGGARRARRHVRRPRVEQAHL